MKTLLSATIYADWFNKPIGGAPTISLAIEGNSLVLKGSRKAPAKCHAYDKSDAFIEGLWERDCAEAFLVNPENGYYLELNLSPKGAWWACLLSARRVRATPKGIELSGAVGSGKKTASGWSATLRIPLASLPKELAFSPQTTRGNLTFCLGHEPQRYLTLCNLGNGEPDFHQPGKWMPLAAK